jgi:hypothetical protein
LPEGTDSRITLSCQPSRSKTALLDILFRDTEEHLYSVKRWLDGALTAALHITNRPDCDFVMASMLVKRKLVEIWTLRPYSPSQEVVDFIVSHKLQQKLLGEEYAILTAMSLGHELL